MVSATDPAAVVATFKRLAVNRSLATIVDGESLLNDGTGLVLFAIAVRAVTEPVGPPDAILAFVASGRDQRGHRLAAGIVAARLISGVSHHLIELTISGVLAYGTYLLADGFHLSGVIATVTAGVVLGNYGPGRALTATGDDAIDTVWEFVAIVLTRGRVRAHRHGDPTGPPARRRWDRSCGWSSPCSSVGCSSSTGLLGAVSRLAPLPGLAAAMPVPWLHVLFWGGLRGAVAVAMALALPVDLPQRALLQEITFGAVLFTLLVQATTIAWVVKTGGADRPPERRVLARVHAYGRTAVAHHSARVWRMLMLWRMPRPIAMLTSDAPPWVTNGSGIPVIGMIPITMPTFTTSWNRIIDANPAANSVPNGSRERQPAISTRQSSSANSTNSTRPPTKPSSSASTENTKSVVWTGRKSPCAWVPFVRPLPEHPARADGDLRLVELVARRP